MRKVMSAKGCKKNSNFGFKMDKNAAQMKMDLWIFATQDQQQDPDVHSWGVSSGRDSGCG